MDILDWIRSNRPGKISQIQDRLEIIHETGEQSTIWLNTAGTTNKSVERIDGVYEKYDGMDLFSSTFKIAGVDVPKSKNGVILVQSLRQFANDVITPEVRFPEEVVPFMYQAGIGFYALGLQSGKIYEWDEENGELSGEFQSVVTVLNEWVKALE